MWNVESLCGYTPKTTFWDDFSIAERMEGVAGVKGTFNRAFKQWKDEYVYLTELVMVLNHKIWQHYEKNEELAMLYERLWQQADAYACEHLSGDELQYFYSTTD